MSLALAIIFFFGLVLGLLALPFAPAVAEWRKRRDDEPLSVVRSSEVDIRHFARSYQEFVNDKLVAPMTTCRQSGKRQTGLLRDGTPYVIVHDDGDPVMTDNEQNDRTARRLILSCSNLRLPEETLFLPEVYADGTVRGGERSIYRAVLADEDICLDRESTSLRWIHARRSVSVKSNGVLYGRVSADRFMKLERGCRFERLNAPRIEFCFEGGAGESGGVTERQAIEPRDLNNRVEESAGRWRVEGRTKVPPRRLVENDLVVTGTLRIGAGVYVKGSLKSHKDVYIERSVEVDGSVVAGRDIYIGPRGRIHGPVLAERCIYVDEGVIVGALEQPTTICSPFVYISPGSTAHGTVWAHSAGWVISPAEAPEPGEPRRSPRNHAKQK